MNILLIRFSSLGDVVLQTSTLRWLKNSFGESVKIYFLTSKEFRPMLEGHPDIEKLITYDRRSGESLWSVAREIKNNFQIDLIFDVHATMRSALLRLYLFSIPRLVIDKRRLERLLLQIPFFPKFWTQWEFFGLSQQVKRIPEDFQGIMHAKPLTLEPLTSTPELPQISHPKDYIVLAPVASFASKHWPVENYVSLAQRIVQETKFDVVIVAGPEDHHCQAFSKLGSERIFNLQGKTKLLESSAWVQGARLVVGNDSGMNHIAEANGVKVLTLFGPTHEAFGFAPHLSQSQSMSIDLWCRPCSATGKRECFRKEQYCMTLMTPEAVWQRVQEML